MQPTVDRSPTPHFLGRESVPDLVAMAEVADENFRLAVEASPTGIVMADETGRIVLVNAEIERLFGYQREELIGRPIDMLIPECLGDAHPGFRSAFTENPARRGMGTGRDLSGLRKDGSEFPVEVELNPITTRNGLVVLSVIVDISERKRIGAERGTGDEQFRLVVEACPSGMIIVDTAGIIKFVNAEIERLFGYPRSELIGQPVEVLMPLRFRHRHPGHRDDFAAHPGTRPQGARRDIYGLRKDGSEFPIDVGLTPVKTHDGMAVLGVVADLSERKRAQEELDRQTRELQRSNAELEQFAYVAAHDLQEPLRMVASYTELLSQRYQGKLDEKADKYIHYAVDGARRMQRLIDDLLAYSRVTSQGKPLLPTQSAAVFAEVVETMHKRIEESGAELVCGALPVVNADQMQLAQLLQNLIGNAIKFRSETPPRIHVEAREHGREWVFSVADNGIGIDMQNAERVFQMFQRLHERGRYEGNGIGLAIAKRIVERHHGRIWVESQPGKGTTFYFTLPKTKDPQPEASKQAAISPSPVPPSEAGRIAPDMKVRQ
jgi:PAS domain S-box-containing protein